MKRTALLMCLSAVCAAAFVSCNEDDWPSIGNVTISAESQTIYIPTAGETNQLTFSTNGEWKAAVPNTNAYSYMAITPTSGDGGSNTINIIVLPNETNDARTFTFDLKCGNKTVPITVIQAQKDALIVTPNSHSLPSAGGLVESVVNTNVEFAYQITYDGDVKDWLHKVDTKGMVEHQLNFTCDANPDFVSRSASILVYDKANNLSGTMKVEQDALERIFEVSTDAISFGKTGGSYDFTVNCNFPYTVTAGAEWLNLVDHGNGSYTVSVDGIDTFAGRSATISVSTDVEGYSAEIPVTEKGQGEYEVNWIKQFSDYGFYDTKNNISLAYYEDKILLVNGNGVWLYVLSRADGSYAANLAMPDGVLINTIDNDDAGHILAAVETPWQGTLTVFNANPNDMAASTPIINYNNLDIWGCTIGNLRAKGDITGTGVVSFICSGANYYIAWDFKNGVADGPHWGGVPAGGSTIWNTCQGVVTPMGPSLSDGLFYVAYDDDYVIEYNADPKGANSWTPIYPTGSTWAEDYNAIATLTFGDTKLLAYVAIPYGDGYGSFVHLLDVTDPLKPNEILKLSGADLGSFGYKSNGGTFSDVLLIPGPDDKSFELVAADTAMDYLVSYKFTMN